MASPRPMKRRKVPVLEEDDEEQELHVQFVVPPPQPPEAGPAPVAAAVAPAPAPALEAAPTSEELQLSPEEEERHKIWDIFSEEYHDIVTELPLEFQRNLHLVRELEDAQQNSTKQLKTLLLSYISSLGPAATPASPPAEGGSQPPPPTEQSKGQLIAAITKTARSAIRSGEDKVGLAVTLYESVDRHIRRLDASLLAHEDSLLMGLRDGTLPSHDAPQAADKDPPGPTTSLGAIALGEKDAYPLRDRPGDGGDRKESKTAQRERERKRKREERRRREQGLASPKKDGLPSVEMLDIPIDPTEPTYCKCNRVSFGNMIGCENEDCPREWFHMECVGLTTAPLGVWYCDDCAAALGIEKKKEPPKPAPTPKEKDSERPKEQDKAGSKDKVSKNKPSKDPSKDTSKVKGNEKGRDKPKERRSSSVKDRKSSSAAGKDKASSSASKDKDKDKSNGKDGKKESGTEKKRDRKQEGIRREEKLRAAKVVAAEKVKNEKR